MKNILVPVGSTENGVNNLQYAVNFASMSGATVYVINLYKEFSRVGGLTKVNQLIIDDNESQLNDVLSRVDTKGVEVIAKPIKGDAYEGIARISKLLNIDLIILSPQSVEIKNEVYLGNITGRIVKQTDIPLLIVPKNYLFRKFETILLAFKNGHFERENVLDPLINMKQLFSAKLNLLHVITPETPDNNKIDKELTQHQSSLKVTENATVFQGVLEHFQSHNPDMLCVLRRKRGFFKKLWVKNTVLKKQFHTSIPLLILKGQE